MLWTLYILMCCHLHHTVSVFIYLFAITKLMYNDEQHTQVHQVVNGNPSDTNRFDVRAQRLRVWVCC